MRTMPPETRFSGGFFTTIISLNGPLGTVYTLIIACNDTPQFADSKAFRQAGI